MTGQHVVEIRWRPPSAIQDLADSGCSDLIPELIAAFTSDCVARLEKARTAAAAGNLSELKTQMHTIKGSALQMGALELAALCRQLEESVSSPTGCYAAALDTVNTAFEQTHRAMSRYVARCAAVR
jgi:HPt (histidine-containing phosphotransfer) domain-containing protein